jgi:hypothetical protein
MMAIGLLNEVRFILVLEFQKFYSIYMVTRKLYFYIGARNSLLLLSSRVSLA